MLESSLNDSRIQQNQYREPACFSLGHKKLFQSLSKQKDIARALVYLNLKECLGVSWDYKTYGGIRCKKSGKLKVSFKI